jgi:hypothetical protein
VAALAGCGGSGESRPTLEQWAARADGICTAAQRKLHRIPAPTTLTEVAPYVERTAPIVDDQLRKLRALERPADHEQVDAYLDAFARTVASAKAVGAYAAKGNEGAARIKGIDTLRNTREARSIARRLGADTCASQ